MGFCRRCGDIVVGERCKCGGTAAAPLVAFKTGNSDNAGDKWTKTYVANHSNRSPSPVRSGVRPLPVESSNGTSSSASNPPSTPKRFPRPLSSSTTNTGPISSRVTDYIAATTSRPRSPLKQSVTLPNPASDIIPSLVDNTLSKVYGSVLQPKETLATYSCAVCSTPFPPDATIYPDPSQPFSSDSRFLCRPCFTENGGSKGPCASCSRPVLTLKAEGGFINAAGKFWHKRCFDCAGCFKNIGDTPLVDLLGRPCCADCFDNCLKRDTPKKSRPSSNASPKPETKGNVGGLSKTPQGTKSREGSPAIEELEQRLGITKKREDTKSRAASPAIEESERRIGIAKKREGSPALEELCQRLSMIGSARNSMGSPSTSPTLQRSARSSRPSHAEEGKTPAASASSPSLAKGSPVRRQTTSPVPTPEAIEEMKQRLLKSSSYSPSPARASAFPAIHLSSRSRDRGLSAHSSTSSSDYDSMYSPTIPPTPDLFSDFSDATTQSSFSEPPDSPPGNHEDADVFSASKAYGKGYGPRYTRNDFFNPVDDVIVEETNSQLNTPTKTPNKSSQDLRNTTPLKGLLSTPSEPSPLRYKSPASAKRETKPSPGVTNSLPSSCAGCGGKLFSVGNGGSFVTIPPSKTSSTAAVYHVECFRCAICDRVFDNGNKGGASFVKHNGKACHPECAPKERLIVHKSPSSPALRSHLSNTKKDTSPSPAPPTTRTRSSSNRPTSSRFEQPAPSNSMPAPRFGSRTVCPGCKKAVSPMERGVIPGPQGTRWHAPCLVCGGKKVRPVSWYGDRGRDEKKATPGCGKKLDSAAKSDGDGGVWCRECMLLLGLASSPQASPTRTPLSPTYTGSGKMVPQFTGTTTIARQFTGMTGGEGALLRQLTGGGLSPTRSISPTKQLGSVNTIPGLRPRPKSVIGMRSAAKSQDEGRGMFLVRQLTGASLNG